MQGGQKKNKLKRGDKRKGKGKKNKEKENTNQKKEITLISPSVTFYTPSPATTGTLGGGGGCDGPVPCPWMGDGSRGGNGSRWGTCA
jgi:hypothetical protein